MHFKFLSFAFAALFCFSSCGEPVDAENEITDPEGVTIELTWSNSAANPAVATNLDLYVRQNFTSLISGINFSSFEEVEITPGLLNNGDYSVEVYVRAIDQVTNYTLKVTGKSTGKSFTRNFGPINANDKFTSLKPWTLRIAADQYTII